MKAAMAGRLAAASEKSLVLFAKLCLSNEKPPRRALDVENG
jgi:hypothetical protein